MKQMKELKKINSEELNKRLEELTKELMKYNAQISTGTPPENPGQVRNVKRTIARIKTIINSKTEVGEKTNE